MFIHSFEKFTQLMLFTVYPATMWSSDDRSVLKLFFNILLVMRRVHNVSVHLLYICWEFLILQKRLSHMQSYLLPLIWFKTHINAETQWKANERSLRKIVKWNNPGSSIWAFVVVCRLLIFLFIGSDLFCSVLFVPNSIGQKVGQSFSWNVSQ